MTRYLRNQVYTPCLFAKLCNGFAQAIYRTRVSHCHTRLRFISGQTQETCTSEYGVPRSTLVRAVDKVKSELGYAELKKGDVVEMYQKNTDNARTTIEAHVLNTTIKNRGVPPVLLPMELAIEAAKADCQNSAGTIASLGRQCKKSPIDTNFQDSGDEVSKWCTECQFRNEVRITP